MAMDLQADLQAGLSRVDVLMDQHVYWSGLRGDNEPPVIVDFDTLVNDKNAPNEVAQSTRIATEVFLNHDNILKLLDLAFPLKDPSNLTLLAFDIFSAFPSNPAIMDSCFNSEPILTTIFTLLHYYVSASVVPPALNSVVFKGKQEFIDSLSVFILTGFKKQERLSFAVDLFTKDKILFNRWVACICNSKAQDVFLFFLTNYQTRTDAITKKIAELCESRSVIRNFVREVTGITLSRGAGTNPSTAATADKPQERSRLAADYKVFSYTKAEACSAVLATILRCNVPHLCDQIFDHYRLILDRYLLFSVESANPAVLSDMLITLKMCGQIIVHMLRYLVVKSIAIHYRELKTTRDISNLSDEFIKQRSNYLDMAINHFIYPIEGEVRCTVTSSEDKSKGPIAETHKYELHPYGNEVLDSFEDKYIHTFVTIINRLADALSSIEKCVSKQQNGIEYQTDKALQVASYLYLFYLSHAIGVVNSSRIVMKLFDDAGDIDDVQSDLALRKIVLMEETSIGEFMWSDMYVDELFSVERVMSYDCGDYLNWKQVPLVISPFLLYSYIVRSKRLCTILSIMKNYNQNTLIQSVGVRIISGIIELGVSLSPKNTELLERTISLLCSFYLKDMDETGKEPYMVQSGDSRPRGVSYIVALKSIFRETMRICTEINSMLLMAIKYDYYAVDMDCLNDYMPDANKPDLVPRTLADFRKSENIRYPKAHALLCDHALFTRCVEALLPETDLHKPLSEETYY